MKMNSKAIAAAVSLAMVFTMMPMISGPVYADDPAPAAPAAINLVENGSAPNITGAQTSSIWFGDYKQSPDGSGDHNKEPIKWRVLSNENGELFLLSDQNLDCKKYNDTFVDVTWETSGIRTWLNGGFKNTAFSSGEQSAIKTTDVVNDNNPKYNTPGGENTQDQIFLLSIEEAANEKYGFTNNYNDTPTREAKNTAYATWQGALTSASGQYAGNGVWWLRSPGNKSSSAAKVLDSGSIYVDGDDVNSTSIAVRPAFNFNLKSVIFTSAAEDSKYFGTVGAESLKEVGTNTTGEWKVTLKSGHDSFAVSSVSKPCNSKEVSVTYSGAITGNREYISAIIKDKGGKVKYYGKLKKCTTEGDASGTVKINVDGKLGADDTLCVFNEQLNGIRYTDFSSELKEIAIPNSGHKYGEWKNLDANQHQRVCEHDATHIEKANHSWDAGKVTKAATEQSEGIKTYTCTVCGETKTEAIPKLDPKPEPTPTPKPTPAPVKVSGKLLPKMTAKKKSVTISWNKIKGVAGYDIFFARCNHDKKKIIPKKVKTIKGNKTFKWTKSGLKKGTAYKAYVKAYVMKNGKKSYVRTSPLIHAYTGNGTKKYTNAKSVNVNKTKVTLKKGKTFKIKAKVNKVKKNKKLMPKSHAPALRYMTTNKKVATVTKSGKITAKGKGTCYIYVYAHNGISKQVKVMVK